MMEVLDACGCQSLHTVNGTVLLLSFTTTAHQLKMVPFEWEQKDLMVSGLLECGRTGEVILRQPKFKVL